MQSISRKLLGGAFAGNLLLQNNNFKNKLLLNNEEKKNECHEGHSHSEASNAHAKQDMDNLQRIFEESGG